MSTGKEQDRAQERLDRAEERLDQAQERIERRSAEAAQRLQQAREQVEEHRGRQGLIWNRPEPGSRNPRFSREKIADVALEIAKAEGPQAISMRRVASELGAGTMTLYHYVANKQELFELMHDRMMAQLLVPEEELEQGWRHALHAIAKASLATWRAHRWQRDDSGETPVFGPNGMRHFEQSLKAVAETGLPPERRMEIISQVDEYVFGYSESGRAFDPDDLAEWDEKWSGWVAGVDDAVSEYLETGDFPNVEAFLGGESFPDVLRRMVLSHSFEERFERGLDRLLDGVQAEIDREAAK